MTSTCVKWTIWQSVPGSQLWVSSDKECLRTSNLIIILGIFKIINNWQWRWTNSSMIWADSYFDGEDHHCIGEEGREKIYSDVNWPQCPWDDVDYNVDYDGEEEESKIILGHRIWIGRRIRWDDLDLCLTQYLGLICITIAMMMILIIIIIITVMRFIIIMMILEVKKPVGPRLLVSRTQRPPIAALGSGAR